MQVTMELEEKTKNNRMSIMLEQEERIAPVEQNKNLLYCVDTILKNQILRINNTQANAVIENDLGIILKETSELMKNVLAECLCYYLRKWPGWYKTNEDEFACTDKAKLMNYHGEIKQYLRLKLLYVIENEDKYILKDNGMCNKMESKEVQTDPINPNTNKLEAPYKVVIQGQPYFLNTVGFREDCNDIVIQQHAGRYLPQAVSHREFLNYPFIEVTVKLPGMELSRNNSHEYLRYLTEQESLQYPDYKFLDFIRKINSIDGVKVYSLDYILAYFKQFMEIIEKQPMLQRNKVIELCDIFSQFIQDVKESNVHTFKSPFGGYTRTMATNVSVRYNIGGEAYYRNKRMAENSSGNGLGVINFAELIIPRMTYSLTTFVAEEDLETTTTSFKDLNKIDMANGHLDEWLEDLKNAVKYHCKLCGFATQGLFAYNEVLYHYGRMHRSEEPIACIKCKKLFSVSFLAANRWKHSCSTNNKNIPAQNERQVTESQPIANNKHISIAPQSITNNIINNTISNNVINYCLCSGTNNVENCNNANSNLVPVNNLMHRPPTLLNGSSGTKNMTGNLMSNATHNLPVDSFSVNNSMHMPGTLLNASTKNMPGNLRSANATYNPTNYSMNRSAPLLNASFDIRNSGNIASTNGTYNPPIGSFPMNNMMYTPNSLLNRSSGTKYYQR